MREEGADVHVQRPGQMGHLQKGTRQSLGTLPSGGIASGALPCLGHAWGQGPSCSALPSLSPPGLMRVRADSGAAQGLGGWQAGTLGSVSIATGSEDWVPMGPSCCRLEREALRFCLPLYLWVITTSPSCSPLWADPGPHRLNTQTATVPHAAQAGG